MVKIIPTRTSGRNTLGTGGAKNTKNKERQQQNKFGQIHVLKFSTVYNGIKVND
jgi:hypothetical protein